MRIDWRRIAITVLVVVGLLGLAVTARAQAGLGFTVRYNLPIGSIVLGQDFFVLPEVGVFPTDLPTSYARLQLLMDGETATLFIDARVTIAGDYCVSAGVRFGFDGPGPGATDVQAAYAPICGGN